MEANDTSTPVTSVKVFLKLVLQTKKLIVGLHSSERNSSSLHHMLVPTRVYVHSKHANRGHQKTKVGKDPGSPKVASCENENSSGQSSCFSILGF